MDLRVSNAVEMAASHYLRDVLTDPEYADLLRATVRRFVDGSVLVLVLRDEASASAFSTLAGRPFPVADGGSATLRFEVANPAAEREERLEARYGRPALADLLLNQMIDL